ncbi:MAG: hypothetical protein QXU18_06050 [Thermoplasmatales archaeon]
MLNQVNLPRITKLILLFIPIVILIFIIFNRLYYFILYPISAVDPYFYYADSPGFWVVDISFWIFTPLYYLAFRRKNESKFFSLIYALCLDGSAAGIFLTFFAVVYGINIFSPLTMQNYYFYGFMLSLLIIVPIQKINRNKNRGIIVFLGFIIAGLIWRFTGTGGVHYQLNSSVVIDMFMIFYSFFFLYIMFRVEGKSVSQIGSGEKWLNEN